MRRWKWLRFTLLAVVSLGFLVACKRGSDLVKSADEVDKVSIVVKDDTGQEHKQVSADPRLIKTLLGNTRILFTNKDDDSLGFSTNISAKQKQFEYSIKFSKAGKAVQEIKIAKIDQVTIDTKAFTINENRVKALNSLKKQLLLVTQTVTK